jgi:hypothetical protein
MEGVGPIAAALRSRAGARVRASALGSALTFACACASALTSSAHAQVAATGTALHERHLAAIWGERASAFFDAWQAAEPAARARAQAALERDAGRGAPLDSWPSSAALERAREELVHAGGLRQGELARQARSLDLQLRPGLLELEGGARAQLPPGEPDGEPLVARVWPMIDGLRPGDALLELSWFAPDGQRLRARGEPILAAAFASPGFEMHLRAPSAPRAWRLVLELERAGERARGLAFDVPRVRALHARLAAVRERAQAARARTAAHDEALERLLAEFELLLAHGLRSPALADPELALALLESRFAAPAGAGGVHGSGPYLQLHAAEGASQSAPTSVPAEQEVAAQPARAAASAELEAAALPAELALPRWWAHAPAQAPRSALVLVCPPSEDPAALLASGPRARAWRSAAGARAQLLLATRAHEAQGPSLGAKLAELRAACPGLPIALVVRGEALSRTLFALLEAPPPQPDAFVLASRARTFGALFPRVPTLLLAPPELAAARAPDWFERAALGPTPFLGELELPELACAFVERQLGARAPASRASGDEGAAAATGASSAPVAPATRDEDRR